MEVIYENEQGLDKALEKWKNKLRLNAWDIKAVLVGRSKMDSPDAQGENSWSLESRESLIKIVKADEYPSDSLFKQDMEVTLVHELLHLHFAMFDDFDVNSKEGIALEQTITILSKILVAQDRAINGF